MAVLKIVTLPVRSVFVDDSTYLFRDVIIYVGPPPSFIGSGLYTSGLAHSIWIFYPLLLLYFPRDNYIYPTGML